MRTYLGLIALTALVLSATSVTAQESYKEALSYQIKAGLVSSYLSSNDYSDTGVGWGWTAGGGLFLPLFSARFGLQAEVMWIQKEAWAQITTDLDGEPLGGNQYREYDFTFQYVHVPVMAHWAFTANEDVRAYLLGGFQTAFNSSGKVKWTDDDGLQQEQDLDNNSSFDWSPVGGIGVLSSSFLVEIRFDAGLKNQGEEGEFLDAKINTTSFLIGFAF